MHQQLHPETGTDAGRIRSQVSQGRRPGPLAMVGNVRGRSIRRGERFQRRGTGKQPPESGVLHLVHQGPFGTPGRDGHELELLLARERHGARRQDFPFAQHPDGPGGQIDQPADFGAASLGDPVQGPVGGGLAGIGRRGNHEGKSGEIAEGLDPGEDDDAAGIGPGQGRGREFRPAQGRTPIPPVRRRG
jgi:hypothetical protein